MDWVVISSLATAGGTLVLAGATFAAVRSANRSARVTEPAPLAGLRPVLVPSRLEDPPQKVGFRDEHWFRVGGSRGVADVNDDGIFLAMAVRNVGNGLAVLDRWEFYPGVYTDELDADRTPNFHRLTRDLWVAAGDIGFWQGALRDPDEPGFDKVREVIVNHEPFTIDVLYGDHEGGQRTVSRFLLRPTKDGEWFATVGRHWNLDRADPR